MSSIAPPPPLAPLGVEDRAARVRFRRAVTLLLMTLVLPGSAQLVAGDRRLGRVALRVWGVLVAVGLVTLLLTWLWPALGLTAGTSPLVLGVLRLVMIVVAIGWGVLFVDAWRLGRPLSLLRNHRLSLVGINGALCVVVVGSLLFGAHVVNVQRSFWIAVAGDGDVAGASDGRYNVLLAGGDAGAGRTGLRPDSLMVASIDAETGRTVLIGLPRNMSNFPFAEGSVMAEQFPDGFDCDGCMLNGVSTWAHDHPELFKRRKDVGMAATVSAVEGITGLEVGYWALVDMRGFRQLVDAFGGVELHVRDRIPVGLPHESYFHHIEPGVRTLDGEDALWFARARHGSDDYSRMARQKCVMSAMVSQVNPAEAVLNLREIMEAGSAMLTTNMPGSEFDRFISLALKAKEQKMSSVSLVPPLLNTAAPDIDVARAAVATAIERSENPPAKKPDGRKKGGGSVTGGSKGSLSTGYVANDTDDVAAAC
ncbi:LCP family protein [Nocardioides sp. Y6]|uniref:LCP family protein n=1 Tax=Nocardioides malaquae TaxID=2773426 RepID=A0ABR9RPE9_9ACTN|nr:LCP family protein [Nocardioides malaquae]MBE7323439.1 LCP family protein [Nocardioides malaquae]